MMRAKMTNTNQPGGRFASLSRAGFTLVEMMIAVGLIILMLTLFASVFQTASSSVDRQRGIAENDQQARSLTRLIRDDLNRRTFRNIVPFYADENPALQQTSFANRRGYFYVAENNAQDDTDNILQFTVLTTIPVKGEVGSPFFGRTQQSPDTANDIPNLLNHPDRDDGRPGNGVMLSTAAEVSYFMRGRNLHRRVMLLRDPLEAPSKGSNPNNPTDNDGNPLFSGDDPIPLWSRFDISMHSSSGSAEFHGVNPDYGDYLDNTTPSLGQPGFRYGFREDGRPFEFIEDANSSSRTFIGRFTAAESSFPGTSDDGVIGFYYPYYGDIANRDSNNPYYRSDLSMIDGAVDQFNPRSPNLTDNQKAEMIPFDRTGEDVVLKNVTGFVIEMWDEDLNAFVRMGQTTSGKFGTLAVENKRFTSPNQISSTQVNRFDTWHPVTMVPFDGSLSDQDEIQTRRSPPLMPMIITMDKIEQISSSGIDISDLGYRELKKWKPSQAFQEGDVVFSDEPVNVPNGWVPGRNRPQAPQIHGFASFFVCRQPGYSSTVPPIWKHKAGERTVENIPPDASDNNGDPIQPVIWEAVENRIPVRAIRITVNFINEEHQMPRQVTMVVSLLN